MPNIAGSCYKLAKSGRTNMATNPNSANKELTIITSHINADFDAVASMLAAQKLYPGSLVVFPGSQEKNIRDFFIQSMAYMFNMADIKEIDFSKIKRLVLVDTRQPSRIGVFASLLNRPDVEIHIYDHHPGMSDDIVGHFQVHRLTGATVTILTDLIREKEVSITADEATIMCLGIYEDTGSFNYASTSPEDFTAAAFLLSRGANLNIVSDLIARELNSEQVSLLNDMLQASTRYRINGMEVLITSVVTDVYVPDFALLVHKMVKIENLDAIFAIAQMGNKIYVTARSRIPEVDVGAVASALGGGGHPYAAAATVKDRTLTQVEHELIDILYKMVHSRRQAQDIMSSPPITVDAQVSCKAAQDLLVRYNINALLVTRKTGSEEKLCGYISRQVIEKALFHKLDTVPVEEYMNTEVASVRPESVLNEIQDKIIENKQRILPVVDQNRIVGVITRTDLLNLLVRKNRHSTLDSPDPLKESLHARTRNISKFMEERLSGRMLDILRSIGTVSSEIGYEAYVVGGFVRDLFLFRPNEDIDIVIEGDGIEFARHYARMHDARIHTYEKFGTAVIVFPDGFKIDVASARLEYYQFPAALPTVEMSSIKLDMFRRDFTINTLAIRLSPDRFGILIDFFSAQKDIKEKAIRVLHNLSFVEDPTRVFRAIRFEQRFGFNIGKLTAGLIKNSVKMEFFKRLSGKRVFTELRQLLEEENPVPAIMRLNDYDLLKVIHPTVELTSELIATLNSVKKVIAWCDLLFLNEPYMKWLIYFMALTRNCSFEVSKEICRRLELAPRYRSILCQERFEADRRLIQLERNLPETNDRLYHKLTGFKTELILYMMAATSSENVQKAISHFFTNLRRVRISVMGRDLLEFGLKPGPVFKTILDAALNARLNGRLKTLDDEKNFVREYISHLTT